MIQISLKKDPLPVPDKETQALVLTILLPLIIKLNRIVSWLNDEQDINFTLAITIGNRLRLEAKNVRDKNS